jgi:hypothetical protein
MNYSKPLTTPVNSSTDYARTTAFLTCGVLVAPVFFGVTIVELLLRPEFDIHKLPISFLSLGSLGWIQDASFAVCGVLALLCALGLRIRLRGQEAGTWGPVLVGLFGLGMIGASLFHPDPSFGFPPGTPEGPPVHSTVHGTLHMAAFFLAFLSLIATTFVFARRFLRNHEKGWAIYSIVTGLVVPVLIGSSGAIAAWAGVIVATAGLVLFDWLALVAAHLNTAHGGVDERAFTHSQSAI